MCEGISGSREYCSSEWWLPLPKFTVAPIALTKSTEVNVVVIIWAVFIVLYNTALKLGYVYFTI